MPDPTIHSVVTKVKVLEERMNTQRAEHDSVLQKILAEFAKRDTDQAKRDIELAKRDADYRESVAQREADYRTAMERFTKEAIQRESIRDKWLYTLLISLLVSVIAGIIVGIIVILTGK